MSSHRSARKWRKSRNKYRMNEMRKKRFYKMCRVDNIDKFLLPLNGSYGAGMLTRMCIECANTLLLPSRPAARSVVAHFSLSLRLEKRRSSLHPPQKIITGKKWVMSQMENDIFNFCRFVEVRRRYRWWARAGSGTRCLWYNMWFVPDKPQAEAIVSAYIANVLLPPFHELFIAQYYIL